MTDDVTKQIQSPLPQPELYPEVEQIRYADDSEDQVHAANMQVRRLQGRCAIMIGVILALVVQLVIMELWRYHEVDRIREMCVDHAP